jgi:hypothetical protein
VGHQPGAGRELQPERKRQGEGWDGTLDKRYFHAFGQKRGCWWRAQPVDLVWQNSEVVAFRIFFPLRCGRSLLVPGS